MLHSYRTARVPPGRDRLTGVVEVDETLFGGPEPGRRGSGTLGKTLAAVGWSSVAGASGACACRSSTTPGLGRCATS